MDPIRKYIIQQIIKQTGKIPRATTLIDNAVAQLKIRLKNAGQDISKITDPKQITQFFNKEKSLWNQNIKRAADAAPKNILKGPQKKPFSGWTPKVVEKSMRPSDYAVLKEEWFGKIIANTDDAVNTFLKKGIDKADNRFLNFSKTQRKDFLDMIDYRLKHGNKKFMNDFTDAAGKFKFPENLAGGGIAGMLGEPTYEDDNHRVPLKDGSWKPPLPDENWMESWWKNLGPWEKISVFGWGLPFEKGGRVPDEDARLLNQLPTQELQIGPYIPELGHKEGFEDNYIEFDDGTVYYKDLGEFYDQEGTQVTSPSAGARPVGEILEAAEGGRVGLAGGGLPAALRLIMQKYGKDAIKLAKDVKTSKKWDTQKAIQEFKKRNPQFKAEGGRVPMWMGGGFKAGKGLLRLLMRHLSKEGTTGLKGSDLLKLTNTKQYHNMLNRPEGIPTLAKEMIEKYSKDMKVERINSVKQALDMAKKMKTAKDKTLAMDKITEGMTKKYVGEGMDEGMVRNLIDMFIKAKYPDYSKVKAIKDLPNVTSQGILELENILKNLATKGRKLNATGGLAKMLGE